MCDVIQWHSYLIYLDSFFAFKHHFVFTARFESGSSQSPSKTLRRTRHVEAAGEDDDDEHAVVCVDDSTSAERVGRDPFSFDDGCVLGELMVWSLSHL